MSAEELDTGEWKRRGGEEVAGSTTPLTKGKRGRESLWGWII